MDPLNFGSAVGRFGGSVGGAITGNQLLLGVVAGGALSVVVVLGAALAFKIVQAHSVEAEVSGNGARVKAEGSCL